MEQLMVEVLNANVWTPYPGVTVATSAEVADVRIFRISSRGGSQAVGGIPTSWNALQIPFVSPMYLEGLHYTGSSDGNLMSNMISDLTWPARGGFGPMDDAFAKGQMYRTYTHQECKEFVKEWAESQTTNDLPGWNATARTSTAPGNVVTKMRGGGAANGGRLYDAIENRKNNPSQKLIVVVDAGRAWTFGTAVQYTGASAEEGAVTGTKIYVSAINKRVTNSWTGGVFNEADRLYIPANIDQDDVGFVAGNPTTWVWKTGLSATVDDNPINLLNKLMEGSLRTGDVVDQPGAAATRVVTAGKPLYVDPVAALQWCATPGSPTAAEQAAIRVLQVNTAGCPNSLSYDAAILNPVDYIDGLIASFSITDAQLLECLFGIDDFKPSGKLPWCIGLTDWDVENQLEDVPNDEANKLFGYRAGLTDHPDVGWQSGIGSNFNDNEWDVMMKKKSTYHLQWD